MSGFFARYAIGALLACASAMPMAQESLKLTISGASPSGLWSMLGTGLDNAVRAGVPGSVLTYQTSGGGLANIGIVSRGQAELGIVHNVELKVAAEGSKPFNAPVTNLRAIAVLYDWAPMQLVMTKAAADKYGVSSVRDIVAKKVPIRFAVNQRGNMVEAVNRAIFEAYGASWADLESWGGQVVYAPGGEMANLFNDRRIDLGGNGVFVPDSRFVEASRNQPMIMLELDPAVIEQVAARTGADAYSIPPGGYEWQDKAVPTVALSAALVASDRMSDETAYQITKSMVEHLGKINEVHKAMRGLKPALMPSLKLIPYHPGALRYYREAGLVKG